MKPTERLIKEYNSYLNTEDEQQTNFFYNNYRAMRNIILDCNLTTVEELNNLETKALIEWENSLTENAQ